MRSSDIIARFIMEMLEEEGKAEFGRNELAFRFKVVPSQINYVISSRFTPELGYIVESRRGGGGFIKISRPDYSKKGYLMHIINSVGESMDCITARTILNNMFDNGIMDKKSFQLFCSAISDKNFAGIPVQLKDTLRAAILKNMMLSFEI